MEVDRTDDFFISSLIFGELLELLEREIGLNYYIIYVIIKLFRIIKLVEYDKFQNL